MYVVFSEIHNDGKVERWYYGCYTDRERANDVAYELGHTDNTWHCICEAEKAKDWGIKNLPLTLR